MKIDGAGRGAVPIDGVVVAGGLGADVADLAGGGNAERVGDWEAE